MKKTITLFAMALLFIASASAQKATKLEVSFNYEKQAGGGSNQYAVWIEDAKGRVVKTLFVTAFTTKGRARGNEKLVRGYIKRPLCVPTWVRNVKANDLTDAQLDAVSGATPQASGKQTFVWDFKDQKGRKVKNGTYKVYVEATLFDKSIITYSGSFSLKGKSGNVKLTSSLTQPDEKHANMITAVKATLK